MLGSLTLKFRNLQYYLDNLKSNNLEHSFEYSDRGLSVDSNLQIQGVTVDSRSVKHGFVFFAIIGQNHDGHNFIESAIENGCSLVVSELNKPADIKVAWLKTSEISKVLALFSNLFYDKPDLKLKMIGVTGTNGKTTTTHLLEAILPNTALIGTLGVRAKSCENSDKLNYDVTHFTTPQAPVLNETLANLADLGIESVAMEVSSHALSLNRVEYLNFDIVCLTNITQDHLDFHFTMENYVNAKYKLFEDILKSCKKPKHIVLNIDSQYGKLYLERLTQTNLKERNINIITYGLDSKASVYAKSYDFAQNLTTLKLDGIYGQFEIICPLVGLFNVYNILASICISKAYGIDLPVIQSRLREFEGVPGRFQIVSEPNQPMCIVDYAHTPDGLKNVLSAARSLVVEGGKLIVVFGCGGDRDNSKRPQMGAIAEDFADKVIVTSDNPRSEDPEQIIADILTGIKKVNNIHVQPDRRKAIFDAIQKANYNDVILIAGKGHEDYQIIKDKVISFDDRLIAREYLKLKVN